MKEVTTPKSKPTKAAKTVTKIKTGVSRAIPIEAQEEAIRLKDEKSFSAVGMPLCIDCAYVDTVRASDDHSRIICSNCQHPAVVKQSTTESYDPVEGKVLRHKRINRGRIATYLSECSAQRTDGICGPRGDLFYAKPLTCVAKKALDVIVDGLGVSRTLLRHHLE